VTGRSRNLAASVLAVTLAGSLVLAGCSSGAPMMRGAGPTSAYSGGMMDRAGGTMPGYHYSPTSCATPSPTATSVLVILADMGLTSMMGGAAPIGAHMLLRSDPSSAAAGLITFVAINRGWRTHELVILPLSSGSSAGRRVPGSDGKVAETGSLGEASTPCGSGAGSGITAGSASWVTVRLPAGRYELVCNLANHYADGMYQELDVG
jgi:uncharacterized cupredoxin-like copper-binding protein